LDTKTRNNKTRQKRDKHKFTTTTASTTAKKKTLQSQQFELYILDEKKLYYGFIFEASVT